MPQGRDSFKPHSFELLVGKTILVRETDRRHVLVAHRSSHHIETISTESIYSGFPETLNDPSIFS